MNETSPLVRHLGRGRARGNAPADPATVRPARSCSPTRTAGKSRRYSMRDVVQLREIAHLPSEGVSLEGIRRVLGLEDEVLPTLRPSAYASSRRRSPTRC